MRTLVSSCAIVLIAAVAQSANGQEMPVADPGSLAFEQGRWEDVITEYRSILEEYPEDRMSWLRIAQAQRELGRHEIALESLEAARTAQAPVAMVELERARNLVALDRPEEALDALESSDHDGLRALELLEEAEDFDGLRESSRFRRVYRSVRNRVYPCESMAAASRFDFWLGEWQVRNPDGTLVGHSTVTKEKGGCGVREEWQGAGGAAGTSLSFYQPSREQWRQVWVGSNGTMFDLTGGWEDGRMRMEGTIEYAHEDRVVALRGTWSVADDGRVRQRMEEFDLGSQGWRVWFDGIYHPVETGSEPRDAP